jgi:predicted heme/steroid binding protein
MAKTFTADELKEFDGSEPGKPVYFAYQGKVYDATDHPLFVDGMHFEHAAGMDLTADIGNAPHTDSVLEELKVVGEYVG